MREMTEVDLLDWLLGTWPDSVSPICVVEGFSGLGKTSLAHKARRAWDGPAVLVSATATDDLETLLFLIASKLQSDGCSIVADHEGGNFRAGLLALLREKSLVILDDFEALLAPETRLPSAHGVVELIREIGNGGGSGRLLLLTTESLCDGEWLRHAATKTLSPPSAQDATKMLVRLLRDRDLEEQVPEDSIADVAEWLGNNPRAMEAFVACLRDAPLDELIDLDRDAWEIRGSATSPQMVARLEARFLSKTLGRLDAPTRLLIESLATFRRSFTVEAFKAMTPKGSSHEALKDGLTSRFLVNRDRKWYTLNPIARQLCLAALEETPRRRSAIHGQAAFQYTKRLRAVAPSLSTNQRAHIKSGADFVEARFHLLQAGRAADFDQLAADYRRVLLQNYRDVSEVPSDPTSAAELLATLSAALKDTNEAYSQLRTVYAQLLVDRNGQGDRLNAYREVTLASRSSKSPHTWILRTVLACEMEGDAGILAVVTQGLAVLNDRYGLLVVKRAAEALAGRPSADTAISVAEKGLGALDATGRRELYSILAFLLTRSGRHREAIDLLIAGYEDVGPQTAKSWRLFEQAAFLAFQRQDRPKLRQIRDMISDAGINEHQPVLCEILLLQLQHEYSRAAQLAELHVDYFGIVAQGAFCWLVEGRVEEAASLFERGRFVSNDATWWLRALIALCQAVPAVYAEAISRIVGSEPVRDGAPDPEQWVRLWFQPPPRWISVFPAFYFPRLPTGLTGLADDMTVSDRSVPLEMLYDLNALRLPQESRDARDGQGHATVKLGDPSHNRDSGVTINNNIYNASSQEYTMGDNYHVGSGIGIGRGARVKNATGGRDVSWASGLSPAALHAELGRLIEHVAGLDESDRQPEVQQLQDARDAIEEGDESTAEVKLRNAGQWALDRANAIGASVAAAAIQVAIGLS
ncbi:hypothetical protein [Pseudokineococcus sp. 1T1Z-3]|uniref:hypothetical protein n=1 Tax=Pseudokineococcus sp. 1T1Z-3 TaxID=3132745 RepID=UPI0030A700D8